MLHAVFVYSVMTEAVAFQHSPVSFYSLRCTLSQTRLPLFCFLKNLFLKLLYINIELWEDKTNNIIQVTIQSWIQQLRTSIFLTY